ncbi:metalloregulator ArsR/SmtB family transcription factor [Ornithinimicrobium sp. F0845]|uniref:ArsR/SmtB family transcription factor n=1 Tax=Ornithinimicrobium sp. F0845 TaxID=2926412 RepID=UPI001FF2E0E9|nr:metalloregulator ArsR/SmtB family transcription factor [Ornithinimicrobium sp. F0845]
MPHAFPDAPLYEIKANLFKALAHPVRVRILELLVVADGPCPVSDLLSALDIEASLLSQHLSVLRRHHVVTSHRVGKTMTYELAHPQVADLLAVARSFLVDRLTAQQGQLAMAIQMDTAQLDAAQVGAAQVGAAHGGTADRGAAQ